MKLAPDLERPPGEPAAPEAWAARAPPRPTAQAACAAAADGEAFAARRGPRAAAPGVDPAGPLPVPGDGAEWIRKAAAAQFPAAGRVPDAFRAAGRLAAAAAARHGEGTGPRRPPGGPRPAAAPGRPTAGRGCSTTSGRRRRRAGRRRGRPASTD